MLEVCVGFARRPSGFCDRLAVGRGPILHSRLVIYFLDRRMVYLGYTQIVLVDLFVGESKLAAEAQSPAVQATIFGQDHCVLLAGGYPDHFVHWLGVALPGRPKSHGDGLGRVLLLCVRHHDVPSLLLLRILVFGIPLAVGTVGQLVLVVFAATEDLLELHAQSVAGNGELKLVIVGMIR